jgi:ectoine hydroxylase-related dioxygenase (phytanoyl-CoA dioxygenase family)
MPYEPELKHLDEHGFAVFRNFLDLQTTAAIRAHMDSLLPPVKRPDEDPAAKRVLDLRHPIPGAIMADILNRPKLLDLARQTLGARDVHDLRLLEQVLIRTDPSPPPAGAGGWHIDMAFHQSHYDARPRQTYYHMVHLCSTVKPGGGAFMIVPGSHKQTYAFTAKLPTLDDPEGFRNNAAQLAGVDVTKGVEVTGNEGDLIVFNPMCLHSGSRNITPQPRYVYFASFMDKSAEYLWNHLRKTDYRKGFPDSMRTALPEDLRGLLEF